MAHVIHVRAAWDDEAGVWYTAETSVPGLLEDEMPDGARLRIVAAREDVIPPEAAE